VLEPPESLRRRLFCEECDRQTGDGCRAVGRGKGEVRAFHGGDAHVSRALSSRTYSSPLLQRTQNIHVDEGLEGWNNPSAIHGHKRKNVSGTRIEKSNMKEPMAMARLAWIAS